MKKQLLILLLACLVSISASAYDFEVDGICYNKNGSEATVTSGTSYSGEVIIPSTVTYDGTTYSVTAIGEEAFRYCDGLTSVTIPNSVTSIGEKAFELCNGLTSVTISDSVTTIGVAAFAGCWSLTSVTIPDSVTSIGYRAFQGCGLTAFYGKYASADNRCLIIDGTLNSFASGGLTTYSIPDSVTSIGTYAFAYCSGLISLTVPDSVTSIDKSAFEYCTGLTYVTLGNSVTSIGDFAFYGCSSLTELPIGNSVTEIGMQAFKGCSGLTSVTIPDSVTTIAMDAFSNCKSLIEVTIGNSVTKIGERAFQDCSKLTIVNYNATVCITSTGLAHYTVFSGCSNLKTLNIGTNVISIPANLFADCEYLTEVSIPDSVTTICTEAFYNCSGLTSLTLPTSVTYIGSGAFMDCKGLTEVTVENDNPANISLGSDVFDNVPTNTCILYVPEGSANLYKKAEQWKDFSNIIEIILASSIELNKNNLELLIGSSETLVATVLPENATDKTVTWRSSDPAVATVDADGNVTAVAAGTATITATCGSISAICSVTVNSIKLEGDANGDGKVNVSDIASIIDYMLERRPNNFDADAADVNKDGKINVIDISGIIQILLSR